jgi:hypothetical protein
MTSTVVMREASELRVGDRLAWVFRDGGRLDWHIVREVTQIDAGFEVATAFGRHSERRRYGPRRLFPVLEQDVAP